ncbi:S-adenosyl-l-methionine hydroxide adenosyltransferase family protein [Halovivax sp.]|uniref:SAM hydrolase/SAM-dependent halogenase family protein n=1 Tax=Halovivax sp. TaxID=1935978 RepID=UPI0025B8BC8B|nr:SAM-dependent chlorinase/fluorinase [Halovivax sp.]
MITLTSDFGSPYPAAMKGVILQRTDARLVDVAHDLPRQDVRAAAFWLREVLPHFPPAVHLVVVDPGVGTDRDALVGRSGEHVLVGPDNGVLGPVGRSLSGDGPVEWFVVDDADAESATFHGRDVFAPTAALVHDADRDELGNLDRLTPAEEPVELRLPKADVSEDRARGEVLVVDAFGNVITNVPGSFLADRERVRVDGARVPVGETFAAVEPGERVVVVGSHGNVELAANRGRGDDAFGLVAGDPVVFEGR